MSKKLILVLSAWIFLFSFRVAYAGLYISEIMYNFPGGDTSATKSREWIEVYNDGGDVDIDSGWRLFDGSANRTINGGSAFTIAGDSYVIFAGDKDTFTADNPGFSGEVYDTGITSLNNTGATLKILDGSGGEIYSYTYSSAKGGAGDGNSLQNINNSWQGATPTPGSENVASGSSNGEEDDTVGNDNNNDTQAEENTNQKTDDSTTPTVKSSSSTKKQNPPADKKPHLEATVSSVVYTGIPFDIEGKALGSQGENIYDGRFYWNFGDGDFRELNVVNTDKFSHTYFYEGEFTILFEHYPDHFTETPDASLKIPVKVISPTMTISRVGDVSDFFVELSNNTNYPFDLSNWILEGKEKNFKIPRGTTISAHKKIIFSPKITGFSFLDKNFLKLLSPDGETASNFTEVLPATRTYKQVSSAQNQNLVPLGLENYEDNAQDSKIILSSAAIAGSAASQNFSAWYKFFIPIISILFISGLAYAAYFIRRKRGGMPAGQDFEILDE